MVKRSKPETVKSSNIRGLINRGDDPYPVDVKAEAVALVYETGNLSETERQMAKRYPERHPSRQLIARWCRQTDPEAFTALTQERKEVFQHGIVELADKARGKMWDALDDMTPGQVPIPAGIAMDKGLRLLEIEGRQKYGLNLKATGPICIVTNAQAPVIEGECTDVTDQADDPGGSVLVRR